MAAGGGVVGRGGVVRAVVEDELDPPDFPAVDADGPDVVGDVGLFWAVLDELDPDEGVDGRC